MVDTGSLYQPQPRFRWPDGCKCCVMLCFDVDGETTALAEDLTLKNRLTTYSQTTYGPSIGVPRVLGLLKPDCCLFPKEPGRPTRN